MTLKVIRKLVKNILNQSHSHEKRTLLPISSNSLHFGYAIWNCSLLPNLYAMITINQIKEVVAAHYGMPVSDLDKRSRRREIVIPRQLCFYFCQQYIRRGESQHNGGKSKSAASLKHIGKQFGDKDHATVMHGIKTVNDLMETDRSFAAEVNTIEVEIKNRHDMSSYDWFINCIQF